MTIKLLEAEDMNYFALSTQHEEQRQSEEERQQSVDPSRETLEAKICHNGGTLNIFTGTCTCRKGTSGTFCEIKINDGDGEYKPEDETSKNGDGSSSSSASWISPENQVILKTIVLPVAVGLIFAILCGVVIFLIIKRQKKRKREMLLKDAMTALNQPSPYSRPSTPEYAAAKANYQKQQQQPSQQQSQQPHAFGGNCTPNGDSESEQIIVSFRTPTAGSGGQSIANITTPVTPKLLIQIRPATASMVRPISGGPPPYDEEEESSGVDDNQYHVNHINIFE